MLQSSLNKNSEMTTAVPGPIILQQGKKWLRFTQPIFVVVAREPGEVEAALLQVETAVNQDNLYAVGFMTYEAGAAYDLIVHAPAAAGLPLLWFGLYATVEEIEPPVGNGRYQIGQWQPAVNKTDYHSAIKKIKMAIVDAYTYQVNYTFPTHAAFQGDPFSLYADLIQAQEAEYTAYLDLGNHVICSATPELFFRLDGEQITTKPMKGTAVRGHTLAEDKQQIAYLQASQKDRAENVMIVDMIRNDLGRVAEVGTVDVPKLFDVERYPTLLQMTSTVTAQTNASISEIMAAMFPCASITGAPKVRTMQIINELEPQPRGVYTGAIGMIAPGRQAQFNVAIRTVVVDRQQEMATYHVGSGIVWDSDAAQEYAECRLKAQILFEKRPSFDLLEALLWTPEEGYFLLDLHMARLAAAAEYFNFALDTQAVRIELTALTQTMTMPSKVRLVLARNGRIRSQVGSLESGAMVEPVRIGLAKEPVDSGTVWLYHKTTHRQAYTDARATRPDCDEVLLWNERGELTEASTSNIVLEMDGVLFTPPVSSGLLAGTFREFLLTNGRIQERTLTIADLNRCEQIYLINSVRKWRRAELFT